MKYARLMVGAALVCTVGCATLKDNSNIRPATELIPSSEAEWFRLFDGFRSRQCGAMTAVVNRLRRLPKEETLQRLDDYSNRGANPRFERTVNITLICRLLFEPPAGGWASFDFGTNPISDVRARSLFPKFPFGVSAKGIPVLLCETFDLFGSNDEPQATLEIARTLVIIHSDLPHTGFQEAANEIIRSEEFQKLYPDPENRDHMAKVIRERAN